MEFPFDINRLFSQRISILDHTLFAGYSKSVKMTGSMNNLGTVVNELGRASAVAQNLREPITSAAKMQSQKHQIYLLTERQKNEGRGAVVGFLKVGYKKLFLHDTRGAYVEAKPLCVLDFYIVEKLQRRGYGLELFEFMLQHKNLEPVLIAYDGPTPKFLSFLAKHYCLTNIVSQFNNFVVFDGFFLKRSLGQFKKVSLKRSDGDIKSFSLPERRIVHGEQPFFSPQSSQQSASSQWTNGQGVGSLLNRVYLNQISSIFGNGNKSPQPSFIQNCRGKIDFAFDINQLFPDRISILDQMVFSSAKSSDQLVHLSTVIDELGRASAAAQQLKSPVTSATKLKSQKHHIYLLKDSQLKSGGCGVVLGFLKVGYKKLFLHDKHGVYVEAEPLCILDFYIVEKFQRQGYGLELFNYMLQHKNLEPTQLAFDGPTPPFLAFLAKYYCLTETVPQANNFLVFREFFHKRTGTPQRKAAVKKPEGEIKHCSITKKNVVPIEQPTQIRTSPPSTPTPFSARKGRNNARQPSPLTKNTTEETKGIMDGSVDYNQLFPERITVVDHTLFAEISSQKPGLLAHIGTIIDELGKASAEARKLRVPLTSTSKLKSQKYQIYLLKEGENCGSHGSVLGMLKVGNKKLFLRDKQGVYIEAEPLCVFDFFIVEKFQRCGYGLELFDYMLQHKNSEPVEIVYDRPTPKLLSFLAKHYCLTQPVPQTNNVVVFEGFFNTQCPACHMLVNQRHLRSQATKANRPLGKRNVSLAK